MTIPSFVIACIIMFCALIIANTGIVESLEIILTK